MLFYQRLVRYPFAIGCREVWGSHSWLDVSLGSRLRFGTGVVFVGTLYGIVVVFAVVDFGVVGFDFAAFALVAVSSHDYYF